MSQLILLIGLPGSGKSTLARQLAGSGALLISTDTIREQLFGDEAIQGSWLKIWAEVQRQFQQAVDQINQGKARSAIFDATNAVRRNRRQVIVAAKVAGFTRITGLWLDTDLETCLERSRNRDRHVPEDVILRMHRCLMGAIPSVQEGMHDLLRYSAFHKASYKLLKTADQLDSEVMVVEGVEIAIAHQAGTEPHQT
ncbi:AAA family ATPase [Leptolyngbya sp. FACHB-671]|uniref:AAA family ATPase n=1 Tax=Leptolyngbya sp. FACHB-671 TaxID=2692812 RepID=UPI00168548E8|nr:AAA family ATPase [Leptolyngbya sp. FACHB-671]MBD2067526.1 AAA family ATPase [Leptolyngbya sp. FACHB-671]